MSLIEKYNISEVDLEQLFEIETKKTTSGFMEKEKLKAASLKILKPYKVKFIDIGNLLSEIKTGGLDSKISENIPKTDKVIQEKSTFSSSNKSSSSGQNRNVKWISIIIVLVVIGWIVKGLQSKVDPCECITLLEMKSSPNSNVGFSNEEFAKWEKCYDEYAGPAGATLKCAEK